MAEFLYFEISEYRNNGITKCRDTGIPEFRDIVITGIAA